MMKKNLSSSGVLSRVRELSFLYTLLGFLVIFVISSFLSPSFLKVSNILTILRQAGLLVILSMGLTAVVITGTGVLCALEPARGVTSETVRVTAYDRGGQPMGTRCVTGMDYWVE